MLSVYYTQAPTHLTATTEWPSAYRRLLNRISAERGRRLQRFRNEQARLTSAFGLLLLEYAMRRQEHNGFALTELQAPGDYKPFCPGRPDFNISHSHDAVYLALFDRGRVGVDVERIRPLEADQFDRMVTPAERAGAGGQAPFFDVWTKKEAVLKAEGQSGVWDMHAVTLDEGQHGAHFKGVHWSVRPLPAPAGYVASLAWPHGDTEIECDAVDAQYLLIG